MPNAFKKIVKRVLPTSNADKNGDYIAVESNKAAAGLDESLSGQALPEVWLYPDSEELRGQTLLQPQRIDKQVFQIGRRASDRINYPDKNPPDLLLYEPLPYSVSKLHCQIEINGDQVVLTDLGSRVGTLLGNKRLRHGKTGSSSMVVEKGTHKLVLGHRDGPFHFRLVVS